MREFQKCTINLIPMMAVLADPEYVKNIFLVLSKKPEKTETNKMFTFQFLKYKIDSYIVVL